MVDFVRVLSLLSLILVGFIYQHLDALSSPRLILTGLRYSEQLTDLVLQPREKNNTEMCHTQDISVTYTHQLGQSLTESLLVVERDVVFIWFMTIHVKS